MDFDIPESLINVLLGMIEPQSALAKKIGEHGVCHGRMIIASRLFDGKSLNILYSLAKSHEDRTLMFQMLALDNIRNAPQARKIPDLEQVVPGLAAYFARDVIDGWLYKRNKDGVLLPWLIHRLRYMVPDQGAPYVIVDLLANTMQSACREESGDMRMRRAGMTNAIVINRHDIINRTLPELLGEMGYFKECAEFKQEYETHARRFLDFQRRFGQQFMAHHAAFSFDSKEKTTLISLKKGMAARCVNDEEILERRFEMMTDAEFWRDAGYESGFENIPLHCYLHLFHLELHQNIWVHVQHVEAYRYQPQLREKLILPAPHRRLIDILTEDRNVLMEDIVEGKSGGTTILCQGAPGLGKTLTAEVYAEVIGKPLYRVHSGQLGITAESVGANLSTILRRAARWDAILLLDEADVYIRCRDNDLQHNAIVAEFLRTLEYFKGLLFMTTNRTGDVDDAILSRCIATIQYEIPSKEDAIRLWHTLSEQFHARLSSEQIVRLCEIYPECSGRDIKELLKLTTKYCKSRDMALSEEAFALCAVFRGFVRGDKKP